jgi:DNA/RNA endonuclease YhcR with UshA esterase domain
VEVAMKTRVSVLFASVVIALGTGVQAWAHHSFAAEYDLKKPITIKGTVVQVRLENPHSWFLLDVKDAATGKVQRWSFEAGTPSGMLRNGYRPGVIKAGDEVTIKGFLSKDQAQKGMLRQLITADGKEYGMFGPQESRQ